MTISTAYAKKEPHFPGIVGYTPLPLMTEAEIVKLPYSKLVAEIRHYLTIVEQKREWIRHKNHQQNILKGATHARLQSGRPAR